MRSLLLVSLLFLTACSTNPLVAAKDFFTGKDKGIEVDTELVVGDKQESNETELQLGGRQSQQAETINNTQQVPFYLLLLLVLGWLLPSPGEMWKGFMGLISFWRRK